MKTLTMAAACLIGLTFAASNGAAQDIAAFDAGKCGSIVVDAGTSPISDAIWCGGGGATLTVAQNQFDHNGAFANPGCTKYTATYGDIHQNELLRLAILDAKKGDFIEAVEKMAACQCHNPPIEQMMRDNAEKLVCWLRSR